MTSNDKYEKDGNSDELSKKFHDRARDIANDLNKQLLNLSTGIIAGIIVFAFNKHGCLNFLESALILLTIIFFGFSILFIILGMQWDASRNYYLGHINDSAKQDKREGYEKEKESFHKRQQKAQKRARLFFLLGILSSIIFLSAFLFLK